MAWYDYPPPTLIGGATPATPNIVGMAYWSNGGTELTALDGTSGKLLWRFPSTNDIRAYSNQADVLLTFDASKKLLRLDPRTGAKRWTTTLGDTVYDITLGADCANLLGSSGQTLGINLQSGQQATCASAKPPQFPIERDKLVDVSAVSGDLSVVGSVQLDNKPVNPEPPRLAVQVSRAGKVLWKVVPTTLEPTWTTDGFHRSLALTPAGILVFGQNSSDHQERWLLLELSTGRTLYQKASTYKVDRPLQVMAVGTLVFVQHDQRIAAYRAATGELIWAAGQR